MGLFSSVHIYLNFFRNQLSTEDRQNLQQRPDWNGISTLSSLFRVPSAGLWTVSALERGTSFLRIDT